MHPAMVSYATLDTDGRVQQLKRDCRDLEGKMTYVLYASRAAHDKEKVPLSVIVAASLGGLAYQVASAEYADPITLVVFVVLTVALFRLAATVDRLRKAETASTHAATAMQTDWRTTGLTELQWLESAKAGFTQRLDQIS
jgi:hypothetical protein